MSTDMLLQARAQDKEESRAMRRRSRRGVWQPVVTAFHSLKGTNQNGIDKRKENQCPRFYAC